MQKFLFILGIVVIAVLIAAVVYFGLTPMGREKWNSLTQKPDVITEAQRKSVENEARAMIASWEADAEAYKNGNEESKASANKLAEEYNEYMAKWGYVFGETLPEGIYAAIEPIE